MCWVQTPAILLRHDRTFCVGSGFCIDIWLMFANSRCALSQHPDSPRGAWADDPRASLAHRRRGWLARRGAGGPPAR
jgi:hypothetical protein